MTWYRISREAEFRQMNTRAIRLYGQEARELVALLNAVRAEGQEKLLVDVGGRGSAGASMTHAVESLMGTIITDVRRQGERDLLEGAIASFFQAEGGPWLTGAVTEYLDEGSGDGEIPWFSFTYRLWVRWACQRVKQGSKELGQPDLRPDAQGVLRVMDVLRSPSLYHLRLQG